jgi:hypothetical protein
VCAGADIAGPFSRSATCCLCLVGVNCLIYWTRRISIAAYNCRYSIKFKYHQVPCKIAIQYIICNCRVSLCNKLAHYRNASYPLMAGGKQLALRLGGVYFSNLILSRSCYSPWLLDWEGIILFILFIVSVRGDGIKYFFFLFVETPRIIKTKSVTRKTVKDVPAECQQMAKKVSKSVFFNRLIYLVYVKYYTKNCLDDYDELFL